MKRLWTLCSAPMLEMLGALAVAAVVTGCASAPPPPPDESQLAAAGFKVIVAQTAEQREHLQTLTPGKISAMQRNGTEYFIYPDAARNRIYVGMQKQYLAYRQLQPNQPDLQQQLNAQQAADRASYTKQDVALQKETKRDLADPYYFWPGFFELDW